MRAAISLLVLLLSMCGVQTESHGTDASTQDVSTELKELRDMMVDLRATLRHTRDDVKVLEAENVAVKQRVATSETKVQALQDTKAEMKTEVDNLRRENAAQEAELALKKDSAAHEQELAALKTRLSASETKVENLEKEIKAAPKVAFSASLREFGSAYTVAGNSDLNLVFKGVITDVGEAYSSATGFFTAPVRGVYYFRFTVRDRLEKHYIYITMHRNGQQIMKLYDYDTDEKRSYLSSGLTLQLEKGDTVNLVLPAGRRLYDDDDNHSTFSGFLLFPL